MAPVHNMCATCQKQLIEQAKQYALLGQTIMTTKAKRSAPHRHTHHDSKSQLVYSTWTHYHDSKGQPVCSTPTHNHDVKCQPVCSAQTHLSWFQMSTSLLHSDTRSWFQPKQSAPLWHTIMTSSQIICSTWTNYYDHKSQTVSSTPTHSSWLQMSTSLLHSYTLNIMMPNVNQPTLLWQTIMTPKANWSAPLLHTIMTWKANQFDN